MKNMSTMAFYGAYPVRTKTQSQIRLPILGRRRTKRRRRRKKKRRRTKGEKIWIFFSFRIMFTVNTMLRKPK